MELHLDRNLAQRRIFPAIDLLRFGTRREELLLDQDKLDVVWSIRKAMQDSPDFIERFLRKLKATDTNADFYLQLYEEMKRKQK